MTAVPRMRTIQQCADYFKELDPESSIGAWGIRQLVNQERIPFRRHGNKILINLDMLIDYYAGIDPEPEKEESDIVRIR